MTATSRGLLQNKRRLESVIWNSDSDGSVVFVYKDYCSRKGFAPRVNNSENKHLRQNNYSKNYNGTLKKICFFTGGIGGVIAGGDGRRRRLGRCLFVCFFGV